MPITLTSHGDGAAQCLVCLAQNYDASPEASCKYTEQLFDLYVGRGRGGHSMSLCPDCLTALRLALDKEE